MRFIVETVMLIMLRKNVFDVGKELLGNFVQLLKGEYFILNVFFVV